MATSKSSKSIHERNKTETIQAKKLISLDLRHPHIDSRERLEDSISSLKNDLYQHAVKAIPERCLQIIEVFAKKFDI